MLNGKDAIIIFSFFKKIPGTETSRIPLVAEAINTFALPPIPVYLSEARTGIYIDSEDKNLDIETKMDTASTSDELFVNQKGIGSVITINMVASKDSIGLTLLSAISDTILSKVTSKEYAVTYLHGAITIFNGLLHSLSISQEANTDKYEIKLEISRGGTIKATVPQPANDAGAAGLNGGGKITDVALPAASPAAGASVSVPPSGGTAVGVVTP